MRATQQPTETLDQVPATADIFTSAEPNTYFGNVVRLAGGLGRLDHRRDSLAIHKQTAIRGNCDTLYSAAVFDLDAGPVTITLPDTGKRLMSLIVIDEDHYVSAVFYGGGSRTFTGEEIGTRYVLLSIRTLFDPSKPGDLEQAQALQDAILIEQQRPDSFASPKIMG